MLAEILGWVLIVAAVLAAIIVALLLIGCFLPRAHVVSRSLRSAQPPTVVWQIINDYAKVPAWWGKVVRVERLPDQNGHEVWRETYKGGFRIQLETKEGVAPERLVRSIANEPGPFSGRWEFALAAEANGSRITITEYGVIANPFFRLLARMFLDPAAYLELYLKALAGKLGDPARING
jgi:uncharacterized protein YndB with AHSA1/START domain